MSLTKIKSGIVSNTLISDRLGYTPLNKSGDTPTGMLDLSNGTRIGGMYHYRKLCGNNSNPNATTFNLISFARYYWGECHVEFIIRKTYFDSADYAHYIIQGHTRGAPYGPGLTMTGIRTTANINAPTATAITYGSGDYGWSTIQIALPAYNSYEVIIVSDRTPTAASDINTNATNRWVLL